MRMRFNFSRRKRLGRLFWKNRFSFFFFFSRSAITLLVMELQSRCTMLFQYPVCFNFEVEIDLRWNYRWWKDWWNGFKIFVDLFTDFSKTKVSFSFKTIYIYIYLERIFDQIKSKEKYFTFSKLIYKRIDRVGCLLEWRGRIDEN